VNIRALNYLRQILWWRKIQTADFGSHWNTCQFTHSVLSTRFRQLSCFFSVLARNTAWQRTKKKEKCNHKTFLLQANFANLKLPASSLALKDLLTSFPFPSPALLTCFIPARTVYDPHPLSLILIWATPLLFPCPFSQALWSLFRQTLQSLFPVLLSHVSLMILSFCCWFTQIFLCVCFLFSQHSAFALLFLFPSVSFCSRDVVFLFYFHWSVFYN